MLPELPPTIEATLLRPRLLATDGTQHVELAHDPDTWRDGDPELVPVGRGVFTVVLADDRATLAQVDGDTESMAVRARFEPLAGGPQAQTGDSLAVELGPSLAVVFEVVLTGDDLRSVDPGWTLAMLDGPRPGELLLVLREELGAVVG